MTGVFGLSEKEIYACARLGRILRYDGKEWKFLNTGTDVDVTRLWGCPESGMYAVGFDGLIL